MRRGAGRSPAIFWWSFLCVVCIIFTSVCDNIVSEFSIGNTLKQPLPSLLVSQKCREDGGRLTHLLNMAKMV